MVAELNAAKKGGLNPNSVSARLLSKFEGFSIHLDEMTAFFDELKADDNSPASVAANSGPAYTTTSLRAVPNPGRKFVASQQAVATGKSNSVHHSETKGDSSGDGDIDRNRSFMRFFS